MERTVDPTVSIVIRQTHPTPMVEYHAINGERWRIYGTCNCCGYCEIGAVNPWLYWIPGRKVGDSYACVDLRGSNRLDCPVRPELANCPECSLKGEYI